MRLECLTCHGTYDDILPDGMRYFHVCPPLSEPELAKAVEDGRVTLERDETLKQALEARIYERSLKRDERAVQRTHPDLPPQIVSAGRGVRVVPPVPSDAHVIVVPD